MLIHKLFGNYKSSIEMAKNVQAEESCSAIFSVQVEEDEYEHVCALVDFAIAMKARLEDVNKHSFNNFYLRVGKLSRDS
jgi:hypothetical protein